MIRITMIFTTVLLFHKRDDEPAEPNGRADGGKPEGDGRAGENQADILLLP